ncbi:hypothetical protein U9M48_015835 [Paspalum notatum var. saurae]|uniref:Uncharacterized protein n=1 Tax=Paspalum notatum var. saurae TaxID=547442 RepID=A0AAQ3T566_PASNO
MPRSSRCSGLGMSPREEFSRAFRAHYIPDSLVERRSENFESSSKETRRYAPEDVRDDPSRAARLRAALTPLSGHTWGVATELHRLGGHRA